jgi:hypothetical protein
VPQANTSAATIARSEALTGSPRHPGDGAPPAGRAAAGSR